MDLVKLSAAGGIAVMAALALAATARPGAAQSPAVELPAGGEGSGIQARIDAAFTATKKQPAFDVGGPIFPQPVQLVPVLPAPRSRTVWPTPIGATAAWSSYIDEAATRFGLPAAWLHGVMQTESAGRTHLNGVPITSAAGAMGLMQVMPATFAEMRARYGLGSDPYDPRTNILAGAAYLREMYDRYGERHFLAAYNAGPGRVDAWLRGRAALPTETRAYTSTLLPRLGLGVPAAYTAPPGAVQDLTSEASMSALLPSPFRSSNDFTFDPASSPIVAGLSSRAPTAERHAQPVRNGSLFVTLTAVDRRSEASAWIADEDWPMCRWGHGLTEEMSGPGRGADEGKIEGRGTRRRVCAGLHVGWRGTRHKAQCAARQQFRPSISDLHRASPHRLRWSAHRAAR